jgi:two-component system response regulator PilR (NtrC family)
LRERKEDIPMLVNAFVEKFSERFGKEVKSVTSETLEHLKNYRWPGNVRELENVIERMMALESGPSLIPEALPENIREPLKPRLDTLGKELIWKSSGVNLDTIIGTVEREFILKALEQAQGAKKEASKLLSITLRSLRYRLEKYDLASDDDGDSVEDNN